MTEEQKDALTNDIAAVINKYSAENQSNTPDFILAQYLVACLETFNHCTKQRSYWTGEEQRPGI